MQRVQTSCVGACDPEAEAVEREFFAGFGQMADGGGDQPADGVVLVVVEIRTEARIEIADRGKRVDQILAVGLGRDQRVRVLGIVVLVVDLADDLFQHILDGDQTGDAAVFVDHDRHVIARLAELAQQDIEALGFRDQHRRAQQFAHRSGAVVRDHAAQQILRQQDPEDFVAVFAMHREARMAGLDHGLHQGEEFVVDRQHHHLCARDHDVADAHGGHPDRSFHDPQGVGVDHAIGLHIAQQFDQIFLIVGLAGDRRAQARQPRAALVGAFVGLLLGRRLVGCLRTIRRGGRTVVLGHCSLGVARGRAEASV